jgi:hypothetical protein
MARLDPARLLYACALLAMPLSYAVKLMFGWTDVVWIDATLVLASLAFLLTGWRVEDRVGLWVLIFAFVSAFAGARLVPSSMCAGKSPLYVEYAEPTRLALGLLWFWVSVRFFRKDAAFVLRWLAVSILLQFAVASYLYAATYGLAPVPAAVGAYLQDYASRQNVLLAGTRLLRMGGTFMESPPFGLFMFSGLVVLILALDTVKRARNPKLLLLVKAALVASLLGSIASLSDEIILALTVLGFAIVFARARRTAGLTRLVWATCALAAAFYGGYHLVRRWHFESFSFTSPQGEGIGERTFHIHYGMSLLSARPLAAVAGIGPGRYGTYAVTTGMFPCTVTPQVTPLAWLVEYGVVGCMLFGAWLFAIAHRGFAAHRFTALAALAGLLIADMFQSTWAWEAWFLALAFLYAGRGCEVANRRLIETASDRQPEAAYRRPA